MEQNWLKNIIEKVKIVFDFKKINSPSLKLENKATEVVNQIGQVNINQGLTHAEAIDLVGSVIDQRLDIFKDEAKLKYIQRTNEFKNSLTEKLNSLSEDERSKLREPDVQLALVEAAKISGRKRGEELRDLLANLVINRIENDSSGEEDLKNIVYNEAILTINKITLDQLKIITLCYLLRHTNHGGVVSWNTFRTYLNNNIKPFLSFKNTVAEFQHIEYAGCGSIGIGSWDFIKSFQQEYSFLFFNLVDKQKIDDLNIAEEVKKEIVAVDVKEDKYSIKYRNKTELENFLKGKDIDKKIIGKIISIYEASIKNEEEIREKIMKETDIGVSLLNIWDKSDLKHLSLTSVGIAIGASYFEQIVGERVDIGIWIN